ncbi:expressed unknown protein [Seminavis robusta]|uniref:Uncharacterized protein n=1 Tax=Seminavis robusta TaxID=568900 RepID=A0A9N8DV84_9STRA|nr:expressed unknown protein [Seminavis robusta]|eukprot:Sro271_g104430.1 n/a (323) ;mRNA; f:10360-11596
MLAADKLQLQSSLKQQATALKEKEFTLHHSNMMTVGTQAAVLAGLDMTMFVEFSPPPNSEWNPEMIGRVLKFLYYITITCAFCANMLVVSQTTVLSVLGAGMALRGPDGSMMTATDGLYEERTSVFAVFGVGLACTLGSVIVIVWIILHWEAALVCMMITIVTCRQVYLNYQRVCARFDFDESETVDFKDIFEGAANIHTYRQESSTNHSSNARHRYHPHQSHKKMTPDSRNNKQQAKRKQSRNRYHHHGHRNQQHYDDDHWDYDNSRPSSPSSNDEVELMIPNGMNSRGVQRRGGKVSANSSTGSQDSRSDILPEHYIQTV